jgi:hypothetical protein
MRYHHSLNPFPHLFLYLLDATAMYVLNLAAVNTNKVVVMGSILTQIVIALAVRKNDL